MGPLINKDEGCPALVFWELELSLFSPLRQQTLIILNFCYWRTWVDFSGVGSGSAFRVLRSILRIPNAFAMVGKIWKERRRVRVGQLIHLYLDKHGLFLTFHCYENESFFTCWEAPLLMHLSAAVPGGWPKGQSGEQRWDVSVSYVFSQICPLLFVIIL